MMEWARFRKYARRMREFSQYQYTTRDLPSPEVFSAMQLCTISEPLFPNLKTLRWWGIEGSLIPFISLFLSPRTTTIDLRFKSNSPIGMVASIITTLPILCPNLQVITLSDLLRDPMIIAAVSGISLATNRNVLRQLHVDCPLTEEASEVLYKLPNLRSLLVVIGKETSLPSASLPNLTHLTIICDNEDGWPRLFRGATFGKLESVTFYPQSKQLGDFLGAFERAALSSSVQDTLSEFYLYTSCPWNLNCHSLLPFTQLVVLDIGSSCDGGCTSMVDDDTIISLSRAIPKLETLGLGNVPCGQITTGVTTKGLVALARHCPNLLTLRMHFQVASLSDPPAIPGVTPNAGSTVSWTDCALRELEVGRIPVPEGSVLIIAQTLLRIFPQIHTIWFADDQGWAEVDEAINHGISPGKQRPLTTPWSILNGHFTGAIPETSD